MEDPIKEIQEILFTVLQEVEIFPTLVYFSLEGLCDCVLPQGAVWPNFEIWECYLVLILRIGMILALVFG